MSESMPERRRSDAEIGALREEVTTLTGLSKQMIEEVTGLRNAMDEVVEISRGASTRVEEVEANSKGRARKLNITVVAMIIAGLAFVIGATIASVAYVDSNHSSQRAIQNDQTMNQKAAYASCTTRNSNAKATHELLAAIISAEQKSVDQKTAQGLIVALTRAQAGQVPVDCSAFLPVPPKH